MMLPAYLLFTFVLTLLLCPFVFRSVGWVIRLFTSAKRERLLAVARETNHLGLSSSVEDDWEKVDAVVGTAPNGEKPDRDWKGVVGFFHPFCNAGGGGERVLWAAIRVTQQRWPEAICVVYTGDHDVDKDAIIKRVEDRFNINLHPPTLHFLYLSTRRYVLASTWPYFTLFGQSLGSLLLAVDAFLLLVPDIFIDTMGYAFTLYLSKLLFPSVPTAAYVHYPTISTDMLESLDSTDDNHGLNAGAGKGLRGALKRKYWHLFASAYSHVGSSVDVVMTNSSWTQSHIQSLWGSARKRNRWGANTNSGNDEISVVFPPVAVSELERQIDVSVASESKRLPHILYIAQYRPEKNHALILHAFAGLLSSQKHSSPSVVQKAPRLILVGSVRDNADATRVYKLRLLAHELQIKDSVEFVFDAPWEQVLQHLRTSSVGVNGMWNEHFGIGVVEYQAAGLISVVNDSGGPKMDIVVDMEDGVTGFHASTTEEYTAAFSKALSMSAEERLAMRQRARQNARRFSEEVFTAKWAEHMDRLVRLQTEMRSSVG